VSDRLGIEFPPPESIVDNFAYYLQDSLEKPQEALELFLINAGNYPESANVYVSLGDAYRANGETQLAIKNLRKALEVDPNHGHLQWTIETLAELQQQ